MSNKIFDHFKKLFNDNGFRLYMIGGTSRDFLLKREILDYDFVTDATPDEMKMFVENGNYVFSKYGCVKVKYESMNLDITTLRKERAYVDSRHPSEIEFTKDIFEDSKRRDFTVNAIYIDENYEIHDFYNGVQDLENKIIKIIGDPDTRMKEDSLRILRAYRFATLYEFEIDKPSYKAMFDNKELINNLKKEKVLEEINKLFKSV